MALPPLASETLDAVYLHAMLQHLEKVLWRARHEVSFFRKEIESLTQQEALPARYRESYGHIVEALLRIEQAIREEEDKQELDPYKQASLAVASSREKPAVRTYRRSPTRHRADQ